MFELEILGYVFYVFRTVVSNSSLKLVSFVNLATSWNVYCLLVRYSYWLTEVFTGG